MYSLQAYAKAHGIVGDKILSNAAEYASLALGEGEKLTPEHHALFRSMTDLREVAGQIFEQSPSARATLALEKRRWKALVVLLIFVAGFVVAKVLY